MKNTIVETSLIALALGVTGCATAGLIYEDVGHPPIQVAQGAESVALSYDSNLNASSGGRSWTKSGMACSRDVLKLVAWGDGTQAAAARQGGITQVLGVDFDNSAILGFAYTENCTIVYGN